MGYVESCDPRKGKVFRIIDKDGKVINKKDEPKISKKDLLRIYENMILTRVADEKALKLQRSGRMGTFAQTLGQEGQIGVAFAMKEKDWLFPSFRETAALFFRGGSLYIL